MNHLLPLVLTALSWTADTTRDALWAVRNAPATVSQWARQTAHETAISLTGNGPRIANLCILCDPETKWLPEETLTTLVTLKLFQTRRTPVILSNNLARRVLHTMLANQQKLIINKPPAEQSMAEPAQLDPIAVLLTQKRAFDPNQWQIYCPKGNPCVVLFIPNSYLYHKQRRDLTQAQPTGFNLDNPKRLRHYSTVEIPDLLQHLTDHIEQQSRDIAKQVIKIIRPRSIENQLTWNLLFVGHGNPETELQSALTSNTQFAGMPQSEFIKISQYFVTQQETATISWGTCYGGGIRARSIIRALQESYFTECNRRFNASQLKPEESPPQFLAEIQKSAQLVKSYRPPIIMTLCEDSKIIDAKDTADIDRFFTCLENVATIRQSKYQTNQRLLSKMQTAAKAICDETPAIWLPEAGIEPLCPHYNFLDIGYYHVTPASNNITHVIATTANTGCVTIEPNPTRDEWRYPVVFEAGAPNIDEHTIRSITTQQPWDSFILQAFFSKCVQPDGSECKNFITFNIDHLHCLDGCTISIAPKSHVTTSRFGGDHEVRPYVQSQAILENVVIICTTPANGFVIFCPSYYEYFAPRRIIICEVANGCIVRMEQLKDWNLSLDEGLIMPIMQSLKTCWATGYYDSVWEKIEKARLSQDIKASAPTTSTSVGTQTTAKDFE